MGQHDNDQKKIFQTDLGIAWVGDTGIEVKYAD